MKYSFFLSAIVAVLLTIGLSSCFYGPYHSHGPRPHHYRPYHHGYHHGY